MAAEEPRPPQYSDQLDLETPVKLVGLQKTANFFGFNNIAELQQFWDGPLWKPYANMINEKVIIPERAKAKAENRARPRLANFATVEALLEEGEANGRGKYSGPTPDFVNYQPIDYYCHAMFQIRYYNSRMFSGLFFSNPSIREHTKLCHI